LARHDLVKDVLVFLFSARHDRCESGVETQSAGAVYEYVAGKCGIAFYYQLDPINIINPNTRQGRVATSPIVFASPSLVKQKRIGINTLSQPDEQTPPRCLHEFATPTRTRH